MLVHTTNDSTRHACSVIYLYRMKNGISEKNGVNKRESCAGAHMKFMGTPFLQRDTTLVTSCLFPWMTNTFQYQGLLLRERIFS